MSHFNFISLSFLTLPVHHMPMGCDSIIKIKKERNAAKNNVDGAIELSSSFPKVMHIGCPSLAQWKSLPLGTALSEY